MLTDDPERAAEIAAELDRANSRAARDRARGRVDAAEARAARAARASCATPRRWCSPGEGWHPGVVGIVASRLAERHWRPTVLLSLRRRRARPRLGAQHPRLRPARGLDACSEHLTRFGGHRAAAGLELERRTARRLPRGLRRPRRRARSTPSELVRTERVDALVGVGATASASSSPSELERLGPFGAGQPRRRGCSSPPPGCATCGRWGRASTPASASRAAPAGRSGSPSGVNGALARREDEPVDLAVRLEVNRWNGAVAAAGGPARALSARRRRQADGEPRLHRLRLPDADGVVAALRGRAAAPPAAPRPPASPPAAAGPARERGRPPRALAVAALAELVSSGESVLAVCADASRRAELAAGAAGPAPLRGGAAAGRLRALRRRPRSTRRSAERPAAGLVLADWGALARRPEAARALRARGPGRSAAVRRSWRRLAALRPGGRLTCIWPGAQPERELRAAACSTRVGTAARAAGRSAGACARAGGGRGRASCASALRGRGRASRARPELAARCVRVLSELGAVRLGRRCSRARSLRVVSSEQTELERSRAFRACSARHEEGKRYLEAEHSREAPARRATAGTAMAPAPRADRGPHRGRRAGRAGARRAGRRDHPRAHRRAARAARRPVRGDRGARAPSSAEPIDREEIERAFAFACESHADQDAQVGRGLHHPPARRRPDLRRAAARHRDALRGAAARHGRGHERQPRRGPRASSATRSPSSSTASPS